MERAEAQTIYRQGEEACVEVLLRFARLEQRLGELVARVRGVQAVTNEIRTIAESISDNDLRLEIAYGIYGDPMFLNLSMTTMPPIHIVVENGRVTLVGRVHTEIESRRAEAITQTIAGPSRVENRLEVDRR